MDGWIMYHGGAWMEGVVALVSINIHCKRMLSGKQLKDVHLIYLTSRIRSIVSYVYILLSSTDID